MVLAKLSSIVQGGNLKDCTSNICSQSRRSIRTRRVVEPAESFASREDVSWAFKYRSRSQIGSVTVTADLLLQSDLYFACCTIHASKRSCRALRNGGRGEHKEGSLSKRPRGCYVSQPTVRGRVKVSRRRANQAVAGLDQARREDLGGGGLVILEAGWHRWEGVSRVGGRRRVDVIVQLAKLG